MNPFNWPGRGARGFVPAGSVPAGDVSGGSLNAPGGAWPFQQTNPLPGDIANTRSDVLGTIASPPAEPEPPISASESLAQLASLPGMAALLQAIEAEVGRRVYFGIQPFLVGATAATGAGLIRNEEFRKYFFIQNTHAAQNLFVGFDSLPVGASSGLTIGPGGFYEPLWVPQNAIFLLGSGAATTGFIIYATNRPAPAA